MCQQGAAAPRDEVVEAASRPTTLPDARVCMAWSGLAAAWLCRGVAFKCPDLPIRVGNITVRADGEG